MDLLVGDVYQGLGVGRRLSSWEGSEPLVNAETCRSLK